MRRPTILKNGIYHIYNRGVSKRRIFQNDKDYRFFLYKLFYYRQKYSIKIASYCLMPNHFHLLLQSTKKSENVAMFMKGLQLSYAFYFNKTYKHSGHVFESSYKNKTITSLAHFIKIMEYIEMNPVRKKLVSKPEDWPYSGRPDVILTE